MRLILCALALAIWVPGLAAGQTFSQVMDIAGDAGPRFTHSYARSRFDRSLFGEISSIVRSYPAPNVRFDFFSDGGWGRILYNKTTGSIIDWTRAFTNEGGPGGPLVDPVDIALSAGNIAYIADRAGWRLFIASFNGEYFQPVGSVGLPHAYPVAVAWDGGSAPFSTENFYMLERAHNRVSYWTPSGGTWTSQWNYGSRGSGVGQFLDPYGICVGRSAGSASGTSVYTANFYVADTRNGRVVWLQRGAGGPTWMGTVTLPDGGEPSDCTVDHWGNVIVSDRLNGRLIKYRWNLEEIVRYGTSGYGSGNLNTFHQPHAVTVPAIATTNSTGQAIWISEGRLVTAERWTNESGALEHLLFADVTSASATGGAFGASTSFRLTDHALVKVTLFAGTHASADPSYVDASIANRSPGWHTVVWDGMGPSGNPAPEGLYHFHVRVWSRYDCGGSPCSFKSVGTNSFYWNGGCIDPESPECNPPMLNVAASLGDVELAGVPPPAWRLSQTLTQYHGSLFRLAGIAGGEAPAAPADPVASVRARGLRSLRLDVPARGHGARVMIRIHTLSGYAVRTLLDETVDAGSYLIGWDGRDDAGRPVAPGVYLAVMSADGFRAIQRLLVR